MRNITNSVWFGVGLIFFIGFLLGSIIVYGFMAEPQPTDCTDYTLNQYEAGDVPVKCIDQFINNPESLTKESK